MKHATSMLSIAVLLCATQGYAMAGTPELHTSVSGKFVEEVTADVAQWHNVAQPKCKFEKVVGAEIAKKDEKGSTEHWTIQACEHREFTYRVFVIHNDNGTITDAVGDIDKPALTPAEPEKK
jgi:hypothetical protein